MKHNWISKGRYMSTMGYILPKLYEECSHCHQGRVITNAKGDEPTIAGPYKIWDKSETCPGGINVITSKN